MTPADNAPADAQRAMSSAAANDALQRTIKAFGMVVERITPWLLDLGSWIFGALIAFNLLILGALLTVGPGDVAVVVSTAALAVSLPLDVAGFFLLRLAQDMKQIDLEEVATQAFQEVGFVVEEQDSAANAREKERRRTAIILRYCYGLLAMSALLTLVSVTAALWHIAWWIALLFVVVAAVTQGAVLQAIVSSGPKVKWGPPSGPGQPRGHSMA